MPITVITGQPGNGKTLLAMEMLEAALKENKRPIYVHGVEGSLPDKARPLADAKDWNSVEDGALIFIDEAWKAFGHLQDARQAKTPDHVLGLAEHRHRGIDFVMTTQMANQLFPFMRGLIGEHIHVVRQFGTSLCTVYRWGELNEDVKSQSQRDKALSSTWIQPSHLFPQYHSATQHTIKRKIPWRIALIPITLVGALVVGWWVWASMRSPTGSGVTQDAGGEAAASASPSTEGNRKKVPLTTAEWAQRLAPRIVGVHGSQPVFDERKVKSEPATYCAVSGPGLDGQGRHSPGRCRCFTEQATVIEGVLPEVCRRTARFGNYDPFRAALSASRVATNVGQKPTAPDLVEEVPTLGESWDRPLVIPGAVEGP